MMPCRPRRAHLPFVRLAFVLILTFGGIPAPAARAEVPLGGVAIVVTTEGDTLYLREGPGFEYERLTSFAEGTVLAVLDGPATSPDGTVWYRVSDGWLTGWSTAEFLAPPGGAPEGAALPLPADALRVGGTGGDGVRLRETPGLEAAILLVIPEGDTVVVAGATRRADGYDWAPVRWGETGGWIATGFLGAGGRAPAGIGGEPGDAGTGGEAPDVPIAVPVLAGLTIGDRAAVVETGGLDLRIRAGIGLDAPVYAYAPAEAVVIVVNGPRLDAAGDEWYGVDYDGVQGWVLAEHLARTEAAPSERGAPLGVPPPPPPPPGQRMGASAGIPLPPPMPLLPPSADRGRAIVEEALRHLDTPYVWGGDGPAGWDCSGLIQWVYARVTGVTLPRVSQQQFLVGAAISANELQAGDLVFFADTAGPGITHNGIALGDGRFVHARGEQFGTTITSLDDPYWAAHYAGARRP